MRTFKEHILEKLKVTSKKYIMLTYKEFYDLLDEYAKVSGEGLLDVNNIIDNDESLPNYKNDESKHIYTITPLHSLHLSSPIIRLRMYDFVLRQSSSATIYINDVKDKEVDFMEDEYIEKAVKYMKETIKNENA